MIRRPPASTRPDPPFPSTTLFRPPPGALRLQFPEGAVERVARAARRQQRLQVVAGRPRLDRAAYALRLGEHMVDIVAEIIDPVALAAPDMPAVPQGGDAPRRLRADMASAARKTVVMGIRGQERVELGGVRDI